MHVEVSVAFNFVISYLYNKLPRRRVDMFGQELKTGLQKKFEGHWYPDKPFKGSAFRCIRVNGEKMDPVIITAAFNAGLDIEEVKGYLPAELTLWIDPSEVSYRIGEKGPIRILYSDRKEEDPETTVDREVQAVSRGFNPEAQCFQPIDSLSSSINNLSLSPSSSNSSGAWSTSTSPSTALFSSASPAPAIFQNKEEMPKFTAATFAQTKFGSTKLKTQVKRPTRLSPTEFGNFFRQRSTMQQQQQQQQNAFGSVSPQRPQSLSPRDQRIEFMVDQQQRIILQAQHQQQTQHNPFQQQTAAAYMGDMYRHTTTSHLSPGSFNPGFNDPFSTSSPVNSLSPDGHKSFMDGLNINPVSYQSQLHHLLVAN